MSGTFETAFDRLLPEPPRRFRTTFITNAGPAAGEVIARVVEAGATAEQSRMLGLAYPAEVYSLSHAEARRFARAPGSIDRSVVRPYSHT